MTVALVFVPLQCAGINEVMDKIALFIYYH